MNVPYPVPERIRFARAGSNRRPRPPEVAGLVERLAAPEDQFGLRLQHIGGDEPWAEITLDGTPDAFTARYVSADGRLVAALLANRPQHAASLRREIATARGSSDRSRATVGV